MEEEGPSTDFGVAGREVNLKERLREEWTLGPDAEVEVEALLSGVGAGLEGLRDKEKPKRECKANLRLVEEGVSERGQWRSSES